jgi:porin
VHDGQAGWYVMGDVVAARLGGNAKRTVTVFGGLIGAVPDYVAFKSQAIAGVVVSGPFASRPEDTLGLVGSYIRLGDRQVDFLQASRVAAGGTDRVYRGEGVFEINYGITAARGVRLSPNLQYVLNPDNLPRPRAIRRSGDILAFGMRLSVDMATILGMPVLR